MLLPLARGDARLPKREKTTMRDDVSSRDRAAAKKWWRDHELQFHTDGVADAGRTVAGRGQTSGSPLLFILALPPLGAPGLPAPATMADDFFAAANDADDGAADGAQEVRRGKGETCLFPTTLHPR